MNLYKLLIILNYNIYFDYSIDITLVKTKKKLYIYI